MSDQNDKKYCGNAKVIKTQYGDLMKISMTEADVKILQESLDNGWVNLVIKERRSPSPKGLTHYLEVDTWKPSGDRPQTGAPKSAPAAKAANDPFTEDEISVDDLPF
jgi:hypothetical protein